MIMISLSLEVDLEALVPLGMQSKQELKSHLQIL